MNELDAAASVLTNNVQAVDLFAPSAGGEQTRTKFTPFGSTPHRRLPGHGGLYRVAH